MVDLKDITGTKITHFNPLGILILAIVVAVISILIAIERAEFALMTLPIALGLFITYVALRKAFLRIDYAGGFIFFSVKKYGLKQILDFQKSIYLAKDNASN